MSYHFATAEKTVLPADRARVFFDGIFSDPRLQHPEGVAVGPDGWIWCGSENGEILRIDPNGETIERVASTGGFILGLAFLGSEALFVCDLKAAALFQARSRIPRTPEVHVRWHHDPELSGGGCRQKPRSGLRQPRHDDSGTGCLGL